jgi:membrane-bound lytic murein transglycosylase A
MSDVPGEFSLEQISFADLPGWQADDPSPLFPGMKSCLGYLGQGKAYRTAALGLTADDLLPLLQAARTVAPENAASARAFFETHCQPFRIGLTSGAAGFVTGFYEPEIEVSLTPDDVWRYPFYARPDELIDLDDSNRPASMDGSYAFGRKDDTGISFFPDRKTIDQGYLAGKGLEIAWAKSKVDVFFVHIQGAARLRLPDGTLRRITYAAKAGHAFSPIGRLLLDRGKIDPARISMQSIRQWLADNPGDVDEVLWHNRSYIFFRYADVSDPSLGPVAAAKVPLIPGRSLAVDRMIHTFGFPFFVKAATLTHLDGGKSFSRLMLALDTGSAIVGPARGDIFTGSGDAAGEMAGTVRHNADFYILIPNAAAARFAG